MTLCDTSAIIALLSRNDKNHQRCVDALNNLEAPLITTWPCLVEAMHILGRDVGWPGQKALWAWIKDKDLLIFAFTQADIEKMPILMAKYQDQPMDMADASLVVAAESLNTTLIFTLDKDFFVYRLARNRAFQVVPN